MTTANEISAPGMAARTAAILFIFVIIFTGLLSAAYLWTKPAIEASATEEKMKLVDEVLPRGDYDNAGNYRADNVWRSAQANEATTATEQAGAAQDAQATSAAANAQANAATLATEEAGQAEAAAATENAAARATG